MDQVTLIEECKLNNKRAQIEVYRKYNQAMFNVAVRMLRNTENSEDIIQDSFLSAFKNIHQYKGEVTFGAWLKKIVIHNCLNFIKKKTIEVVQIDETDTKIIEFEDKDNWEFEDKISIEFVKNCIDKLPKKYKFVVMLYLIEGYDHIEISDILNISIIASRTQLMRGKTKLRQLIKTQGYETES